MFFALCAHTPHGEVRDLKAFESPLTFISKDCTFPLSGLTTGQVEIFYILGREAVSEKEEKIKSEIHNDLSEIM